MAAPSSPTSAQPGPAAVLLVHEGRLVEVRADNPKVEAVLTVDGEEISRRAGRLVLGAGLKLGEGVALIPARSA